MRKGKTQSRPQPNQSILIEQIKKTTQAEIEQIEQKAVSSVLIDTEDNLEIKVGDVVRYVDLAHPNSEPKVELGSACDKCGAPMQVKNGRYGPFLACTAYPQVQEHQGPEGRWRSRTSGRKVSEVRLRSGHQAHAGRRALNLLHRLPQVPLFPRATRRRALPPMRRRDR